MKFPIHPPRFSLYLSQCILGLSSLLLEGIKSRQLLSGKSFGAIKHLECHKVLTRFWNRVTEPFSFISLHASVCKEVLPRYVNGHTSTEFQKCILHYSFEHQLEHFIIHISITLLLNFLLNATNSNFFIGTIPLEQPGLTCVAQGHCGGVLWNHTNMCSCWNR